MAFQAYPAPSPERTQLGVETKAGKSLGCSVPCLWLIDETHGACQRPRAYPGLKAFKGQGPSHRKTIWRLPALKGFLRAAPLPQAYEQVWIY